MTNSKKNHAKSNNSCFTNVFQRVICAGNLPTHPSPDEIILVKNDTKKTDEVVQSPRLDCSVSKNSREAVLMVSKSEARARVEPQAISNSPGIVARLMGLDSLPRTSTTNEALFRSKSLNSLHFLPDFDPARAAYHRHARTSSASFREQGHIFLVKIDENVESTGVKIKEFEKGHGDLKQKKERIRANVEILKGNECKKNIKDSWNNEKRYQERYYSSTRSSRLRKNHSGVVNNKSREKCRVERRKLVNNKEKNNNVKVIGSAVTSKRKVDHKQDVCDALQDDALSKSPVSVLDHHLEFDSPLNEDARKMTPNSRRKPSTTIKNLYDMTQQNYQPPKSIKNDEGANKNASRCKSMKTATEVGKYFVDLLGQVHVLAEEQLREDSKLINPNYEAFKDHYMEQLCQDYGQELLDELIDELTFTL